jgi:uncharacterized membrane protein YbhN (UPF0104 family)
VTITVSAAEPGKGSRWMLIVKISVSTALLALLFSRIDVVRLWAYARKASPAWLLGALLLYLAMILISAWRWGALLHAQRVPVSYGTLTKSFLVATFYNNFLPSNIGGDVIRIADTVAPAGSRTLAATIVLVDRGIGLLALALVAAVAATATASPAPGPIGAATLWGGFGLATAACTPALLRPHVVTWLLRPLRVFHAAWIDERVRHLTGALERFRARPASLLLCFVGAIGVQLALVGFYTAVARSMHIPVSMTSLAMIVPITFIVQMLPLSINGFGLREATFGFYFTRLGLPLESALIVSFAGAALTMLFSTSGAAVQFSRRH